MDTAYEMHGGKEKVKLKFSSGFKGSLALISCHVIGFLIPMVNVNLRLRLASMQGP